MKIKSWLLLTYLLVMLIPLGAFYGLYVSINAYYQDKNVDEYFNTWSQVTELKKLLSNQALYTSQQRFEKIEALTSNQLMITLYSPNGKIYYSSDPLSAYSNFEARSSLYKNLYELKQNYKTFVYKEPVYKDGAIKGVYKITLARTEWLEEVNSKSAFVIGSLIIVLLLVYSAVVYFLNHRLNRPVKQLIEQMRFFAKGEPTTTLAVQKDELGELTDNFQMMQLEIVATRDKLNSEQRQKEFMIASLSHDLKTPLTSIQAYTESLLAGKLSEREQQEYLQIIHGKSDFMKQLLDDLMMFTLLQSNTYDMELVEVDGREFFEMLLSDYEQISIEKGFKGLTMIQLENNYLVNPKQLMRVVDNVVSNAWTYTNIGGDIAIAAFESEVIPREWSHLIQYFTNEGLYMVIENSGVMLTEQQCQQIFEPLHQLDESRSSVGQRGAGLGLSIAKQIIEKHNGTIQAVSQSNKTAMIIWLPKIEEREL
ncbi:sensor histidine kinase [Solibacillus daqui]|uniref:sensor histidine kinase n=1 Tax=Solibacillus daqui TaxID=2912187 RepID=UPI002366A09C|nr:ATP-binding protein [Solibacillus daqui]